MATTIYFKGNRREVRDVLRRLPQLLAGRVPDPTGLVQGVQLRTANALLSQVNQDYITKARGGTGKDGVTWEPLDPKTIAARTRTPKEKSAYNRAKRANSALTKLAHFGGRVVDILIDTRRLFRSTTPGVEDRPSGNPDQALTLLPGQLILGNNVPYFDTHQNGTEHVPARPIYPVGGVIPDAYMPAVLGAMGRGMVVLLLFLLQRRR